MCDECDVKVKAGLIVCLVAIIVTISLIASAIHKLDTNEVGLDYSQNTLTIDFSSPYTGGIHWLGVGHRFIKFPTLLQELDFSGANTINARTLDGISTILTVRVFYRLDSDKDSLGEIYLLFKDDWKSGYTQLSRAIVRDVAARYTAFQFYNSRSEVEAAMNEQLGAAFLDWKASVSDFKLQNFDLPAAFRDAVSETDKARQEKEIVDQEADIATTQTATKVEAAFKQVNVTAFRAQAEAVAISLDYEARANATIAAVATETEAYSRLQDRLGFTPVELQAFVWLYSFAQASAEPKMISVTQPALFNL
jgi:regulator of protease activity HflC (stomatin/prohibitin superfamily)